MATTPYETVDGYVAAQPMPARAVLERVRAAIRKALPGATEGISYQIPIYRLDGAMVLYFAGFRHHYSVYPATPGVVRALKGELAGRLHSKATIRFPLDEPVPTRLIARVAKLRAAEVTEARRARSPKRRAPGKAKPRAPGTAKAKGRGKPGSRR